MTPNLNLSLAKAKAEFPAILANKNVKIPTKTGREISFTYAELEEIAQAVTPILSTNGLAIAHQMQYIGDKFFLVSTLRHESGEQIESLYPLPGVFNDAKDLGTQISYGRRYNTLCLLDITVVDSQNWEETKRKIAKEIRQEAGLIQKPVKQEGSILHDMSGISPKNQVPTIKNKPLPEPQSNRELLMQEIDSLCKRKGITPEVGSSILMELYKVKGRSLLTDEQLVGFRDYLSLRPNQTVLEVQNAN